MSRKHKSSPAKIVGINVLKFAVFILLSCIAIRLGMLGGSALSSVDSEMVQNVDVEFFKAVLNNSVPLINTTYNSGNISVSVSGEIRSAISDVFGFDVSMPISILTAQSSHFLNYYNGNYRQYIIMRDLQNMDQGEYPPDTNNATDMDDVPNNTGQTESPGTTASGNTTDTGSDNPDNQGSGKSGFIEAVSSISTDVEEKENRDISNADKVSTGKIEILNETKNSIDTKMIETLLKEPLKFKFDRNGPKVLIFHTHATEGFIKNLDELKDKEASSWTRDSRNNIVRVGAELAQHLKKNYDIDVIHNGTEHDYPDYNSSYKNAYQTLKSILPGNPSVKVALDIHRDALGSTKLRGVKEIDGKTCAQVMIVVAAGNPNWKENFKLAVKLQEKLNKYAPGLARPIYVSKYTYNQNMTPGSLTIEIGGNGNTLAESLESTKYIAMSLSEVLNNEA